VLARDVAVVGQAGGFVFRREAGDVVGRFHGLLDGGFGEIAGGGIAALFADVNRDAQRLVAVAFHVFQLAFTHADRQAAAFGSFGRGIRGAQFFGVGQSGVDEFFEKIAVVAEARFWAGDGKRCGLRRRRVRKLFGSYG
jgi:hypothetical protein